MYWDVQGLTLSSTTINHQLLTINYKNYGSEKTVVR